MDPTMMYMIISLFVVFIMILGIVFLRNRLVPLFRLWYIVMVYGKFSFEFLEFFKENNLRNPHNNCIRDEITLHFSVFFKLLKNAVSYQTETLLEYGNSPFLSNYKSLVKRKGNPECINVARFGESKVKVVGYNEMLSGFKMKSLYYFVDEKLTLGEYIFAELQQIDPSQIIRSISSKYLNNIQLDADCFYITDPLGNKLNYEHNGFSINIRYLFLGNEQINEVLGYLFSNENPIIRGFGKTLKDEELLNRF